MAKSTATAAAGSATASRLSLDFQTRLNAVYERINAAERFEDVLWEMRDEIRELLKVERMTVYERSSDGRQIVSRFKTGDDIGVIRLPLSPDSIAGYVAMSQKSAIVDDVYDPDQLAAIHQRLKFDYSYDQEGGFLTKSMMAVPICFGDTILGVFQVINRPDGSTFGAEDLQLLQGMAKVIAQKIRFDRETTQGPYELLVEQGRISQEQMDEVQARAAEQEISVARLLEREFEIKPEEVGASLSQYYQVPFMGYDPEIELPWELMETLNRPFLIRNLWVPIAGNREKAVILIDNPNDADRIMDIQRILSVDSYEFLVGLPEDILRYLGVEAQEQEEEVVAEIEEEPVALQDLVGQLGEERAMGSGDVSEGDELIDENAATVVQLVNKLIADAVALNASDIHVEPSKGTNPAHVRMRVDGVCRPVLDIPATHIRYVVARIKIMSKLDIAENRLPQDGKIACRLQGRPLELRVATVPTVNGESVVMRILAAGDPLPFDKLNLADNNTTMLKRMLEHPHGIILVVGPTGSGKTTTLHAILGTINTPERKILTAEDPVEITQPGLQQIQIRSNIGLDFARALRAFLRADPDVILIGEMRDYETAHSGIEASLTGHLVMSTLHTNSAPETITRLLDMGLDPLNFSDALLGVVAQRLVRTLCKDCKETYTPDAEEFERLVNAYGPEFFPELGINEADVQLCRAVGCEKCGNTGYRGRTGLHEVLEATRAMKNLIVDKPGAERVREQAMQDGMRNLMMDGIAKIFKGQVDLKQVRAVALA